MIGAINEKDYERSKILVQVALLTDIFSTDDIDGASLRINKRQKSQRTPVQVMEQGFSE